MTGAAGRDVGAGGPAGSPECAGAVEQTSFRERKKTQRRAMIHRAALRLVEEVGFEATTIDAVCAEAGISPRTFFNYFPSKGAAVLGVPEAPFGDEAIARYRAASGNLVDALCELVGTLADRADERVRIKRTVDEHPELSAAFSRWVSSIRQDLADLACERAPSAVVGAAAAGLVVAAFRLAIHEPVVTGESSAARIAAMADRLVSVRAAGIDDAG